MGELIELRVDGREVEARARELLEPIYEYNRSLRGLFYLKPVHIVYRRGTGGLVKVYFYYGRYWYRVEYAGKRGNRSELRWIYLGRERPPGAPPPPPNPLEGLSYFALRGDESRIYVDARVLVEFAWFFESLSSLRGLSASLTL